MTDVPVGNAYDKYASTNPIERVNGEIKRRTNTVGIFPNEAAVVRLVGALLLEQSDEWATQRSRYMSLEGISAVSDTGPARLSAGNRGRQGRLPGVAAQSDQL